MFQEIHFARRKWEPCLWFLFRSYSRVVHSLRDTLLVLVLFLFTGGYASSHSEIAESFSNDCEMLMSVCGKVFSSNPTFDQEALLSFCIRIYEFVFYYFPSMKVISRPVVAMAWGSGPPKENPNYSFPPLVISATDQ